MASKEEKAIDGDNEGPVREKLKQTSIDTLPKNGATTTENGNAQGNTESTESPSEAKRVEGISTNDMEADDKEQPRGRHTRKRSYDDLIDISEQGSGHQIDHSDTVMAESKRKRSSEARSQERPISGKEDAGIDSFPAGVKSDSDKFMGDLKEPHMEEARAKAVTPDRDEIMGIDRVLSPKKKRSRDQFDKDLVEAPAESTAIQSSRSSGESERDVTSTGRASRRSNREGPEKKRPRDVSKDAFEKKEVEEDSGLPKENSSKATSDISNVETKSSRVPEGRAALSPPPQTSSSAFAASGFGALANSATSPFSSLAPTETGKGTHSFGSLGASNKPVGSILGGFGSSTTTTTAPLTSFASAAKSDSAFGNATSGLSVLGGSGSFFGTGFGGPVGGGPKSFGSFEGSTILGLKQTAPKPFGAPAGGDSDGSSDGEEDDDEEKDGSVADKKESKQDQRFQPQEVETGEAGEETILTCRAKLFHFSKGSVAWKERGTGTLKLNTPIDEDYDDDLHEAKEDSSSSTEETEEKDVETSASSEASTSTKITPKKKKPRLIMRADGVMRVLLNAPILKDMTAIIASVNQPNVVSMTVIEDGEPLGIRLRINTAANAKALCQEIEHITETL